MHADQSAARARLARLQAEISKDQSRLESALAQDFRAKIRGDERAPWWIWPLRLLVLGLWILVPFVILVGGSVWIYRVHAVHAWIALSLAGLVAAAVLTLFAGKISAGLTGKRRLKFVGIWLAAPSVLVYSLYVLLVLSQANAKTDEIREYYRTVHPLLRVALGTAILGDDEFVLTDALRAPEDYAAMGLPVLETSLHFVQSDGYAHAVDVRTNGRSEWRNGLMSAYFRIMGFNTIRHVGTADHLHISLSPPNDLRK